MNKKMLFGLVFLTLVPVGVSADAVAPIHHWKFDEGTGRSVNDSIGGQNGVILGESTGLGWAGGKVGVSLGMDGKDGTGVALPDKILQGSQGTISVWFRANAFSDRNILFSAKSTTDNSLYAMLVIDRDGRPMFQYRDASGIDRRIQGTQILNANEWYHLVFSANGQRYRFFVNGTELNVGGDGNARWFPELTNQYLSYRIGILQSSPINGSFDGNIDDLRIYDRELTIEQVTSLYEEGNISGPTVPVAALPQLTLSASSEFVANGVSSLLNWSGKNITSCEKSGSWSGQTTVAGSESVQQGTYILTCVGKYGSTKASVTVSPQSASTGLGQHVSTQDVLLVNPMTETERQRKIAEIRAKIMELIAKLQLLISQMAQKPLN